MSGREPVTADGEALPAGDTSAYAFAMLELLGEREPLPLLAGIEGSLRRAITDLEPDLLRRSEAPGKWSIIGVIHHLIDTEMTYGYRVRAILTEDGPALSAYDQDVWADTLRYGHGEIEELVEELTVLRRRNLRLFRSLVPAELERHGQHDERGRESVGHILRLLAAHDIVHLRQIERIRGAFDA